jgi:hypothetical protein
MPAVGFLLGNLPLDLFDRADVLDVDLSKVHGKVPTADELLDSSMIPIPEPNHSR